jgi:hypothetical protein
VSPSPHRRGFVVVHFSVTVVVVVLGVVVSDESRGQLLHKCGTLRSGKATVGLAALKAEDLLPRPKASQWLERVKCDFGSLLLLLEFRPFQGGFKAISRWFEKQPSVQD